MPEFFNVFAPDVALRTLLDRLQKPLESKWSQHTRPRPCHG